ncbi:MAG: hypothetical protein HFE63_02180 [Clostridiales bacterium]|nr:hypothetical protein [Clostridiales bacterium]
MTTKQISRTTALLLTLSCIFSCLVVPINALSYDAVVKNACSNAAEYIKNTVKNPTVGSIGGEWAIIGLARGGYSLPQQYWDDYYAEVVEKVKTSKGILHQRKYTEYSRVVLALTAIGIDPTDVAGYDLLKPLGDFNRTKWQGINGSIWALLALDSGNYIVPENPEAAVQATRRMYIDEILSKQLNDGGWALNGDIADPDITAMALQALAPYRSQIDVSAAIEAGINCLSLLQNERGGYSSWGTENAESCAQVIVAMCALGISQDDERFVKNKNSVLQALLSFQNSDGSFRHTLEESESNQMSTEQGLYALAAVQRSINSQSFLYDMTDTAAYKESLPNKHSDVKTATVSARGITFSDIPKGRYGLAVETLAERKIINGKTSDHFDPSATMTRAEFAAIIVKALGLPQSTTTAFSDVPVNEWYAPYVGAAYNYRIVFGVGNGLFDPNGTITNEEAAVMVTRAAALCGLNKKANLSVIEKFVKKAEISDWAMNAVAFCSSSGILTATAEDFQPKNQVLREEVAYMVYRMLLIADIL